MGFLRASVLQGARAFSRKFLIEIKFFSASPRLRGAIGFSGFSPCLRAVACPEVRRRVAGFGFLVVIRLRCGVLNL